LDKTTSMENKMKILFIKFIPSTPIQSTLRQ
jgi:hypothetical protein